MVSKSTKQLKIIPISFICTTYKRPESLYKLLKSLNNNTILPSEVIVFGTNKDDFESVKKSMFRFKIKKLISKEKNQIVQRNLGIKNSKNSLIIQSDDDLIFERNFIKNFYKHFKKDHNQKKIIGALILNSDKKNQSDRWNNLYENYYLFRKIIQLLNNFKKIKYMSLLSSGRIAPLLPSQLRNKDKNFTIDKLEWMSSTLCYNKKIVKKINLRKIIKKKKSYFEDVFFTHYNFKNGFDLILDGNIICYHETTIPTSFNDHIRSVPIQWELVKFFKKNKFLFFVDVLIFSFIYGVKRIF